MFPSFNPRAVGLALPPRAAAALAAQAGFEGVDLLVRDLIDAGDDPALLRRLMDDLGLRAGAGPLPVDWRGSREAYLDGLRRLPRYARAWEILGCRATGTWILPEIPAPASGVPPRDHLDAWVGWHVRRLAPIARILHDHGCRLGLEVIGVETSRSGRGRPFIHRLADLGPILNALDAEVRGVGVLVDVFHLYAAGEPAEHALTWGVERICWVHVADLPPGRPADRSRIIDAERGLPGEHGAVDAAGLLRLLDSRGYSGPVTAEPLGRCQGLQGLPPETVARKARDALRAVWPPEGVPLVGSQDRQRLIAGWW
jgi:sugar phosphate isomerase/epimerase